MSVHKWCPLTINALHISKCSIFLIIMGQQGQKQDVRRVEGVQKEERRHEGMDQPQKTEQHDLLHHEEEEEEKEPEQNLPDENALERESHIAQPVS